MFYDIRFDSFPKIKHACAFSAEKLTGELKGEKGELELIFVEEGEFAISSDKDVRVCESGHLYPLVFDKSYMIDYERYPIKLISVCVEGACSCRCIDPDALSESEYVELMKELLDPSHLLIPAAGLSALQFDWLEESLRRILRCSFGERIGEETRAVSLWLDLASRITKSCMNMLAYDTSAIPTSSVAYSEMAAAYIIKNYKSKITVGEIADRLGLSPNYLHAIFKQVKGTTLIDYLTAYRMKLASIYMSRFGMRAKEAALAVGIDDPAYFSRIFKKTYAKSASELKSARKANK